MRILLASPGLGIGGAERVVVSLAAGLRARGHEVAVSGAAGPLDAELGEGVMRLVLPERGRSPLGLAEWTAREAAFIRAWRPHVIHAHNTRATVIAAAAARLARGPRRPPILATHHGAAQDERANAARLLARAADAVVVVAAELLPEIDRDVIPNGIPPAPPSAGDRRSATADAPRGETAGAPPNPTAYAPRGETAGAPPNPTAYAPRSETAGTPPTQTTRASHGDAAARHATGTDRGRDGVLYVGRLEPVKNPQRFLDVAAQLPDVTFTVAGDGSLRDELKPPANATLLGARDDARELMAHAQLLLVTSDSEGQSIAVLEALAAETPVVTTPVPGMRELAPGVHVVDSFDPAELAAAVRNLLDDDETRATMGAAGAKLIAERFSADAMVDAYERRYRALTITH